MRILHVISAFGAFLSSIICNPPIPQALPNIYRTTTDGLFYYMSQLFFIDANQHELCAYHEHNGHTFCAKIRQGPIAFAIPIQRHVNHFVLCYYNRIIILNWNSSTNNPHPILTTFNEINDDRNEPINFGIGDALGGLWFWTLRMGEPISGSVWSYHPNYIYPQLKEHTSRLQDIAVSNGIVWKINDQTKLYCIDGMNNKIISYKYSARQRSIGEKIGVVFDLSEWYESLDHHPFEGNAMLGRMTIDSKGRLYVPIFGGSHVLQINPRTRERVKQIIRIPAVKVIACAFGGIRMNVLYVSTIACDPGEGCPPNDQGGKIFAVPMPGHSLGKDAMPFVMPVGMI